MSAIISECEKYRYTLHRKIPQVIRWVKPCLFVMLNPSKATADLDDHTIRRCLGFANREGCTSLTVVNLFAFRSTKPKGLLTVDDPVGPENDAHILEQVLRHSTGWIIAAWGAPKVAVARAKHVLPMLGDVWCLGTNQNGSPKHPLFLDGDTPFVKYKGQLS